MHKLKPETPRDVNQMKGAKYIHARGLGPIVK